MFLKPPQLESSQPAIATSDVDLGFKIEKAKEKAEERAKEKILPDKNKESIGNAIKHAK